MTNKTDASAIDTNADTDARTAARRAARRAASRAWQANNRERLAAYQREYRLAKKARLAAASGETPVPSTTAISAKPADARTYAALREVGSHLAYIHARLTAVTDALAAINSRLDRLDRLDRPSEPSSESCTELSPEPATTTPTTKKQQPKAKMFR